MNRTPFLPLEFSREVNRGRPLQFGPGDLDRALLIGAYRHYDIQDINRIAGAEFPVSGLQDIEIKALKRQAYGFLDSEHSNYG
ncbi:MAG: hypothetical protein WB930_13675, partial [Syntrophobacteraceae bacterium]